MIDKVLKTIKDNNMFQRGDKVIVAVSGGPDSIALLNILHELKKDLQIEICAAHVNHCLRGEEADADEEYVRRFCENLNINFKSKRVDINELAKARNISSETAGREVRYEFFRKLREDIKAQKVAIAHNANDQAETVLMRIMRGTGLEGLIGIRPVRDEIFVRPIINNTREEVEEYCRKNKLNPRIDKTNFQSIYSRNKIRLELIPYIQQNFNKDIISVLNRLADTIKTDNDYLEIISKEKYKKYCEISEKKVIISKEAFLEHQSIITRIIRLALYNITGSLNNFEKIHIYDVMDIQKNTTGKRICLPKDVYILNNYGDIIVHDGSSYNKEVNTKEYLLREGVNKLKELKLRVAIRIIDAEIRMNFRSTELIKYFDYDKIGGNMTLRFRRDGDRIIPLGMVGSKKLKDLFIDLKIPKEQRNEIPLICFNDQIAWIVGYRVSESFKISKNTRKVLEVKIESEEF